MNNDASLPAAVDSNRELIIRAQRGLLERMQKDLQGDALSSEQLLKYAQALNDMLKQVGAHDKVCAVLEIARLKAAAPRPAARASARPSRSSAGGRFADDGPDAPYGRRDDGTPYTHQEFKAALARSVRDIYGISMPDRSSHEPPESAAPQSASHAARQGPKSTRVAPLSSPLTPAARAATLYWPSGMSAARPGGMSAARSGHPSALSMLAPSRKHATRPPNPQTAPPPSPSAASPPEPPMTLPPAPPTAPLSPRLPPLCLSVSRRLQSAEAPHHVRHGSSPPPCPLNPGLPSVGQLHPVGPCGQPVGPVSRPVNLQAMLFCGTVWWRVRCLVWWHVRCLERTCFCALQARLRL